MAEAPADLPLAGARLVASSDVVRDAWRRLAADVQRHVIGHDCLLLGILMGGVVPLVQIATRLRGDFVMDYCHLTRYRGGTSGGEVRWVQQPRQDMRGRTIVLVDDIFDQGVTLAALRRHCEGAGAREVRVAVLVRKHHSRPLADIEPDYVGIELGDDYVFGCGMDYQDRWRHLDAIYALPGLHRQ